MKLTRREILASSVTCAPFFGRTKISCYRFEVWIWLDEQNSLTRESALGYLGVLSKSGNRFKAIAPHQPFACSRVLIVPAAPVLALADAQWLQQQIKAGCRLIFESSLGFFPPQEMEHQRTLFRNLFDLDIQAFDCRSIAPALYIRYRWPSDVFVRHFSRIACVNGENHLAIADIQGITTGVRKRIGRGELIFVGSPLGPMLLAQDREATLVFQQMLDRYHGPDKERS